MMYKILAVLLVVSTFQTNGVAGTTEPPFEFVIEDVTTKPPEAPHPQPPATDIITFLEAMNHKLDRVEEALALMNISLHTNKCDNTAIINAIREGHTTGEVGQFNLEKLLLKNRELVCDAKKCPNKKIDPEPDPVVTERPPTDDRIRDCCKVQKSGKTESGIYTVFPYEKDKAKGVEVYCDMTTKGGGWTVFQRREEVKGPTESFQRNWAAYEAGFGDKSLTFWLGLPHISALTEDNDQALRYDMSDWKGIEKYAEYDTFLVGGVGELYKMTVSGFSGNAGDSFSINSGMGFSTLERDNDAYGGSCADLYKGAWWYRACHWANPNGIYVVNGNTATFATGVNWLGFHNLYYSLKRIDMKVRSRRYPNGCAP